MNRDKGRARGGEGDEEHCDDHRSKLRNVRDTMEIEQPAPAGEDGPYQMLVDSEACLLTTLNDKMAYTRSLESDLTVAYDNMHKLHAERNQLAGMLEMLNAHALKNTAQYVLGVADVEAKLEECNRRVVEQEQTIAALNHEIADLQKRGADMMLRCEDMVRAKDILEKEKAALEEASGRPFRKGNVGRMPEVTLLDPNSMGTLHAMLQAPTLSFTDFDAVLQKLRP